LKEHQPFVIKYISSQDMVFNNIIKTVLPHSWGSTKSLYCDDYSCVLLMSDMLLNIRTANIVDTYSDKYTFRDTGKTLQ